MLLKSEKENVRIDQYLTEELDISRSKVQKLIKDEKVSVNGKIISNNYKVKLEDEIEDLSPLIISLEDQKKYEKESFRDVKTN